MSADRENLENLLREMLALNVAVELGYLTFPADMLMEPIRRHTSDTAQKLIDAFERETIIFEVKNLILRDVRAELLYRSRIARAVEWGIILATLAVGAVISVAQLVYVLPPNVPAIVASYWIILILVTLVFLGFIYLKIVDPG